MKKLVASVVSLLMMPALVSAQNSDPQSRGQGYFFLAPIVSNPRYVLTYQPVSGYPIESTERGGVNAGFGGEGFVYKGLGIGAEAAYAGPHWSFGGNDAIGIVSIDASYHFFSKKKTRGIEIFEAGGYSLYYGYRTSTQNGFNLGGGVNWWVSKRAALRLEVVDQDHIQYFHSQFSRFIAFRVGMTFR